MRETRTTPIGANAFALRVDSYSEDGVMTGAIDGRMLSAPKHFESFFGLVLLLDEILDEQSEETVFPERDRKDVFKADLELEVLFRQHASWQGRVRSVKDSREASFKSVLELMGILDSVMVN